MLRQGRTHVLCERVMASSSSSGQYHRPALVSEVRELLALIFTTNGGGELVPDMLAAGVLPLAAGTQVTAGEYPKGKHTARSSYLFL